MRLWEQPVIFHGAERKQARRLAAIENQLAAAMDVAKLRRNEAIRNAKSQYEADVAVAEAEHRTATSEVWLDKHFPETAAEDGQEGM